MSANGTRIMAGIITSGVLTSHPHPTAPRKRKSISVGCRRTRNCVSHKWQGTCSSTRVRLPLVWILAASVSLAAHQAIRPITAATPERAPSDDPYRVTTLCTAVPVNTGRRVTVSNGAEFQRALDTASAGDTILLATGTTFSPPAGESFVLRNRHLTPGQWIVIRSANTAFDANGQIAPGTRVTESN